MEVILFVAGFPIYYCFFCGVRCSTRSFIKKKFRVTKQNKFPNLFPDFFGISWKYRMVASLLPCLACSFVSWETSRSSLLTVWAELWVSWLWLGRKFHGDWGTEWVCGVCWMMGLHLICYLNLKFIIECRTVWQQCPSSAESQTFCATLFFHRSWNLYHF